jgi:PhnB protein
VKLQNDEEDTMSNANQQGPTDGLSPYLQIGDAGAAAAADFYIKAFGAEELMRMPAEDGKRFMHIHLRLNGGSLMMADSFPEHGCPATMPGGITLHLQVGDADAWFDRAVAAGAEVAMPLENMFWGDRYGQIRDPFGFTWSIGGPVKG